MFQLVKKTPGNLNALWEQANTGDVIELGDNPNVTMDKLRFGSCDGNWIFNHLTNLPVLKRWNNDLVFLTATGEEILLGQNHLYDSVQFDAKGGLVLQRDQDLIRLTQKGREMPLPKHQFDLWGLDPQGRLVLQLGSSFTRINRGRRTSLGDHQFDNNKDGWTINPAGDIMIIRPDDHNDGSAEFLKITDDGQEHSLGKHEYNGRWFDSRYVTIQRRAEFLWFGDDGQEHSLGRHPCEHVEAYENHIVIRRESEFLFIAPDGQEHSLGKHLYHPECWKVGPLGILIEQPNHFFILVVIK